ncbi:TrkA family potassium uptake protein [Brachybacterium sp. JHP9]|uniref:Trk system potassium uptake protein TrkA n=1 Tax=Brachybacterium equifaecis TaxID=2910770 RepID=A0ABT0R0Q0_9MICO|nr:TrkA family potassium uptake protein [Brachybacterium equifaecis]MCL6423446.1 TrkA family potassium uptake protein [Brachybacterium equifaecis]
MRVVIIGAGSVGRSIARELISKGRSVTLIDRAASEEKQASIPQARWVLGDAAEIGVLSDADLSTADVVVAATGDDKVNLVTSMLAKTEFLVPRTVARVSHPSNEWMFGPMWGVDVAVSTPRMMTALVEEAVSVGRAVTLFTFAGSPTRMVEITIPRASRMIGRAAGTLEWPPQCVLVGIIRDGQPIAPTPHDVLEPHDELLLLAEPAHLRAIEELLSPAGTAEDPEELPSLGADAH